MEDSTEELLLEGKRSLRVRTKQKDQEPTISESSKSTSTGNSGVKRSSRLRDPEVAAKHKAFLQKVVTATNGSMDNYLTQEQYNQAMETDDSTSAGLKRKLSSTSKNLEAISDDATSNKRRKSSRTSTSGTDTQNDCYCWICHKEGDVICCETCPRVFHLKCIQMETAPTDEWVCPECILMMTAENMDTRSRAMRLSTVDQLCVLLKHALSRMRTVSGVEPFQKPVDPLQFPAYKNYVFVPMDLSTIEKNIKKKQYGSTEAFLMDVKWILHNCIIFNSLGSKLTAIAKSLVKVCKHEMQEIENCPDCYLNAHTRKDSWFVAACRIPHLLVWAKLKGFPYWPAKAMRINSEENVDVRFFGAHDRAWIPLKDVFLFSEEPPIVVKKPKRGNLEGCIHEVDLYIKNIKDKFGKFTHAPPKVNVDPRQEQDQILLLYPDCTLPFDLIPRKRTRTYSFSGSERSHTATPTPSDAEITAEDESQPALSLSSPAGGDNKISVNKNDNNTNTAVVTHHTQIEDEDLEPPPLEIRTSDKVTIEDELLSGPDGDDELVLEAEAKNIEAKAVSATISSNDKAPEALVKSNDRAAASPPCEVSSTTLNNEEKKLNDSKTEVIAETSETVVIEGGNEVNQDEEEIDDDEEGAEAAEAEKTKDDSSSAEVAEKKAETEESTTTTTTSPLKVPEEKSAAEPVNASTPRTTSVDGWSGLTVKPKADTVVTTVAASAVEEDEKMEVDETQEEAGPPPAPPPSEYQQEKPKVPEKDVVEAPLVEEQIPLKDANAPKDVPPPLPPQEEEKDDKKTSSTATTAIASSEEEIDDEEPELVIEEDEDNLDRLEASGISVTVIEKKKFQEAASAAKASAAATVVEPKKSIGASNNTTTTTPATPATVEHETSTGIVASSNLVASSGNNTKNNTINNKQQQPDIGLISSDISVTVVHKKKVEVGGGVSTGPKISLKKESELLQNPPVRPSSALAASSDNSNITKKDNVEVTTRAKIPGVLPNRRSSVEIAMETGKTPPDPIVSITKVHTAAQPGASLLKNSAPKSSSPALMRSSAPPTSHTTTQSSGSASSLASILGQPRMTSAAQQHPRFPPGGGRSMPPPHIPRNSSPLMGPLRAPPPVTMGGGPMGMPNLHPRPPSGVLGGPSGSPPVVGPVSEQINKVAGKLVDYMRGTLEELFKELSAQGSPEATIKSLQLEMEKMQWRHQQELAEMKHNTDLLLMELRQNLKAEEQKVVADIKKQADIEKNRAVAETKKKQWCAHCGKEAIFYCCWNTSYCDYPCQQAHWPTHMSTCAQNQSNQDEDGAPEPGESGPPHDAVQHFLSASGAGSNANSRSNGLGSQSSRNMQPANPMIHPQGPFGLNPRMMNQLNMRMAAAAAAHAAQPPLGGPRGLRFPGSYFM